MKRSSGFTAVEAALLVVAVALVGFVGYRVYSVKHAPVAVTSGVGQTKASSGDIKDTTDLTAAEQKLDNEQLDTTTADEAKLDAEVATF
jgi:hypothetical protein